MQYIKSPIKLHLDIFSYSLLPLFTYVRVLLRISSVIAPFSLTGTSRLEKPSVSALPLTLGERRIAQVDNKQRIGLLKGYNIRHTVYKSYSLYVLLRRTQYYKCIFFAEVLQIKLNFFGSRASGKSNKIQEKAPHA